MSNEPESAAAGKAGERGEPAQCCVSLLDELRIHG